MNALLSKSLGVAANSCHCYELVFNSVEGYAILLGRKLEVCSTCMCLCGMVAWQQIIGHLCDFPGVRPHTFYVIYSSLIQHRASEAEYSLRGCMYNTTLRGFIGRFHDSLPFSLVESLHSGAVICPINQVSSENSFEDVFL